MVTWPDQLVFYTAVRDSAGPALPAALVETLGIDRTDVDERVRAGSWRGYLNVARGGVIELTVAGRGIVEGERRRAWEAVQGSLQPTPGERTA